MLNTIAKSSTFFFSLFFICYINTINAKSSELKGADTIISEIEALVDSLDRTATPTATKRKELVRDLEQFSRVKDTLPVNEAATQWVSLVQKFFLLPELSIYQIEAGNIEEFKDIYKTTTIKSVFEVIPGPDSWEHIITLCRKAIENDKDQSTGLRSIVLFMNILTNKTDELLQELDHFEKTAIQQNTYSEERVVMWFNQMRNQVKKYDPSRKDTGVLDAFETLLKSFETHATQPALLNVPDLAKYTDSVAAEKLLRRALATNTLYITIPSGEETRKLGVELALQQIDTLKRPQWGLVHSIETTELFEKLYDKFILSKVSANQDYEKMVKSQSRALPFKEEKELKKQATAYYILGLLAQDRREDAVKFTLSLEDDQISSSNFKSSLKTTEDTDILEKYSVYLSETLRIKPDLPLWKQFVTISLISSEEALLKMVIKDVLDSELPNFVTRQEIKKHLITVLLAEDKVDDALAIFREIANLEFSDQTRNVRKDLSDLQFKMGQKLYLLGSVLKRDDISAEGISLAMKGFRGVADNGDPNSTYLSTYRLGKLITILIKEEQYATAEKLIAETIKKNISKKQKHDPYSSSSLQRYEMAGVLAELATVYNEAGRYQDGVTLLDQSPWWNAEDLSDLYDDKILYTAALALYKTGNPQKAEEILKNHLIQKSNDDEAYRLLIDIAGQSCLPWLERLYRMDRFEERPLIWKAKLLFMDGQLDEAEKVIRQAMKVDPTDGEQKAGQRVYSYELLSDILAAKGDTKSAQFFQDVVRSVRIAEKGDELTQAGLTARSIDYYHEANSIFADAYCIQWRLAERLFAKGDFEGSKKHYKIAFEQMPEQFGRVASFCFGCEGAFDKMQSRSAAEEVFSQLLELTPDRPQVYFLIGLLRKAQGKIPDAYDLFKKAVELDIDYLDAWKEISKLSSSVYLSRTEKDDITIKMLSLDPQQKHFFADFSDIADWQKLWKILVINQNIVMKPQNSLYVLEESRRSLHEDQMRTSGKETPQIYFQLMSEEYKNQKILPPSHILSQHRMVRTLDYFLSLERYQQ